MFHGDIKKKINVVPFFGTQCRFSYLLFVCAVANKWFHTGGQEFARRCSVDPQQWWMNDGLEFPTRRHSQNTPPLSSITLLFTCPQITLLS